MFPLCLVVLPLKEKPGQQQHVDILALVEDPGRMGVARVDGKRWMRVSLFLLWSSVILDSFAVPRSSLLRRRRRRQRERARELSPSRHSLFAPHTQRQKTLFFNVFVVVKFFLKNCTSWRLPPFPLEDFFYGNENRPLFFSFSAGSPRSASASSPSSLPAVSPSSRALWPLFE